MPTCQLWEGAEERLVGDGCEGDGFVLDRQLLLGFHGLVQPIAPAPAWHGSPRELIHNDDLLILHNVVHIRGLQLLSLDVFLRFSACPYQQVG